MNYHAHTVVNGIVGVVASFGGMITTLQHQLEWWIRITGGMIGVMVGLITLVNLLLGQRKK
jgi:hypothetical protein